MATPPAAPFGGRRRTSGLRAIITLVAAAVALATFTAAATFVPAAGHRRSSARTGVERVRVAAAPEKPEYKPYDWQKAATLPDEGGPVSLDDLPDLPGFDAEEAVGTTDDGTSGKVASLGARVRRVEIPELPGDPDLLPPEPNPITDGGLGLWEWTGIWVVGSIFIAALGGAGSYFLARASLDPEFADTALMVSKLVFGVFQVLFLGRVLLTQFPSVKTTDMPWAPIHYSTEWALAPTRAVFKPEAGVDVAPILWLLVTLLASELIAGPSGILQMAKDGPKNGMPPGMSIR